MHVGDLVRYHEPHPSRTRMPESAEPEIGVIIDSYPGPYYTVYFAKHSWRPEKSGVEITYIAEDELEVVSEGR